LQLKLARMAGKGLRLFFIKNLGKPQIGFSIKNGAYSLRKKYGVWRASYNPPM
jgi:hypothetical protein